MIEYQMIQGRALLAGRARSVTLDLSKGALQIEVSDFADAQHVMELLRGDAVATHSLPAPTPPPAKPPPEPLTLKEDFKRELATKPAPVESSAVEVPPPAPQPQVEEKPAVPAPEPAPAPAAKPAVEANRAPLTKDELPDEIRRGTLNALVKWCYEKRGLRTPDEMIECIKGLDLGCINRAGDQLAPKVRTFLETLAVVA